MLYKEDKEYMEHVGQLIAQPRVQKLKTITHHIYSKSCLGTPSLSSTKCTESNQFK